METLYKLHFLLLIFVANLSHAQNTFKIHSLDELAADIRQNNRAAVEEIKLLASSGMAGDAFGFSVSISGDKALIGAPGTESGAGAVYVFDLIDGNWQQTVKLQANDKAMDDQFGYSVSLSGNRALIGAYLDDDTVMNSGSAYVFELSGDSWIQTGKLTANDAGMEDQFGFSVSLLGDRALIGAFQTDDQVDNSGSAYVFDLSGGSWSQNAKLISNDAGMDDWLGYSVSLGIDKALLGARLGDTCAVDTGSAYVFEFNMGSWVQAHKLIADDASVSDQFGYSVSIYANRILIGAALSDTNGGNSGSAYIFDYSNSTWIQTVKLLPLDGAKNDFFGGSVDLYEDQAIVGSLLDDDNGSASGSAYIFDLSLGSWIQTAKLKASDGIADDSFGISVSISGYRTLIGANLTDANGANSGAVYVYKINEPPYAVDDSLTVLEDAAATLIHVLDNDTDVDAGFKVIIATTQPNNGEVLNSATLISYQPDADYCNDGMAEDSFTYTLNGGSVATVLVRVTCTYEIGGSLMGLANGSDVVLQNSLGNNLQLFNDDPFAFTVPLIDLSHYDVSVFSQPSNPVQTCIVSNPSGLVAGNDISNIAIVCNTAPSIGNDNYDTSEDGILNVLAGQLFVNDSDDENDSLFVNAPGIYNADGIGGLVFIQTDGSFEYMPTDDLFGQASFAYDVSDGINQVSSVVTFDVQAVNDAPSFDISGDIDASTLLTIQDPLLAIGGFANNFVFGPVNEASQQVLQFNTEVYSDFNNILNSITVDNNGILFIDFTLNYGAAIIHLSLQDNGTTDNGGEDTSSVVEFVVVYTDLIYANSFELVSEMRVLDYLDSLSHLSPLQYQPIYNSMTNSIDYYGHSLKLNENFNSDRELLILKYWLNEIFQIETRISEMY